MENISFDQPLAVTRGFTLPQRAILAPMQGVMTSVFAAALAELKLAPAVITPFLSVGKDSVPSPRALRKLLAHWRYTPDRPVIVQLMGRDPDAFAETAYRLAENGYPAVNLNFACPAPTVIRAGHGGACLREPELIGKCLHAVLNRCGGKVSLSVKLRTGWQSAAESDRIAGIVKDSGTPFAIVHFRTVSEMYHAVPDPLDRLARFRKMTTGMILFGNGDIHSYADARTMCLESGCDGIAAARGIMQDPFLFRKIAEGNDVPASDEDRMLFLKTLFRCSARAEKWRRNGFLECIKMCFGERELFQRCIRMSDAELSETFSR